MLIFIDSNIFYNNWYLENANFKNFLNYVEKSNSTILVSEIVCQEIDNKFSTDLSTLKKSIETGLNRSKQFLNKSLDWDTSLLNASYSLKKVILRKTKNIVFIKFDDIPNEVLVSRAIKRIKPFQDKDKGFRDTLIWLSLLQHLENENSNDSIAFINNNSSDFFNSEKTELHSDLKEDIKVRKLKNSFEVYKSINDFIGEKAVVEHQHINSNDFLEKYIYPNESLIENQIENYINFQSTQWFNELIKESSPDFKDVNYILSYNFEIFEGIEDPELINWSFLEKDYIYTELEFSLRIVNIQFKIPRLVYNDARFNLKKTFPDIKRSKDIVSINTIRKVFVNTSFHINKMDDEFYIDDLGINDFRV